MEKNKSIFWLISLRLILLLIIVCPLLFVVGCKETSNNVNVKTNDISTQSTEPEQEEPEPTPIDFAVSWQLSSDFQQSGLNIYTSTYTGQDLLAGVNVDDDLNGLISIIVEYNGEVVTKITNAGEYVITAQYDGEDYVLSNNVIIVEV